MSRVSAQYAAVVAGVAPVTLHRWVRTGRLTRHPDGYDLADVLRATNDRDLDALLKRAGKNAEQRAAIHQQIARAGRVA